MTINAIDTISVLTVSQLNNLAKQILESVFQTNIQIQGEISNFIQASSGHCYFSLKDHSSNVRCVMFRSQVAKVAFQVQDGQNVVLKAMPTLYSARGDFQLQAVSIKKAGLGQLYEKYHQLKKKLTQESLFDLNKKQPIPEYPLSIAVLTSEQGDALHDIQAVFLRNAPHIHLKLYPIPVQGKGAAEMISEVLIKAAKGSHQLILLCRGGGSYEDLWQFNEEILVRQIYACRTPIVTGIGHESDTTLSDLVADYRASTPTAAAEKASIHWVMSGEKIRSYRIKLHQILLDKIPEKSQKLDMASLKLRQNQAQVRINLAKQQYKYLSQKLTQIQDRLLSSQVIKLTHVKTRLMNCQLSFDEQNTKIRFLTRQLLTSIEKMMASSQSKLVFLETKLLSISPERTLKRGYSIVRTSGKIISSVTQIDAGQSVEVTNFDGSYTANVTQTNQYHLNFPKET